MKDEIRRLLVRTGRTAAPTTEPCPHRYVNEYHQLYRPGLEDDLRRTRATWPHPREVFKMMMETPEPWEKGDEQ